MFSANIELFFRFVFTSNSFEPDNEHLILTHFFFNFNMNPCPTFCLRCFTSHQKSLCAHILVFSWVKIKSISKPSRRCSSQWKHEKFTSFCSKNTWNGPCYICWLCHGNHMIIYSGMCFPVDEYNYTSEIAFKQTRIANEQNRKIVPQELKQFC